MKNPPTEQEREFLDQLAFWRKLSGKNNQVIAETAQVNTELYSKIERGKCVPRLDSLLSFARAIDCDIILVPTKNFKPIKELSTSELRKAILKNEHRRKKRKIITGEFRTSDKLAQAVSKPSGNFDSSAYPLLEISSGRVQDGIIQAPAKRIDED